MPQKKTEIESGLELDDTPVEESTETQNPPTDETKEEKKEDGGKKEPDPNKKMGLVTFIQLAKPNKYVEALLKNKEAMAVHTAKEWQQIINDLLKKKV